MRKAEPSEGATRIIKRFLLLPTSLLWDNAWERRITRWWEFAEIEQRYNRVVSSMGLQYLQWEDMAWADISEHEMGELVDKEEWEEVHGTDS